MAIAESIHVGVNSLKMKAAEADVCPNIGHFSKKRSEKPAYFI
jgi:hypothetical protein